MSFRRLVLCSGLICGSTAFLGWLIAESVLLRGHSDHEVLRLVLVGGIVGAAIGAGLNTVAMIGNPGWKQLIARVSSGVRSGGVGGALGMAAGQATCAIGLPRAIEFTLFGLGVGVAEGLLERSPGKIRYGAVGGLVGGLAGGTWFDLINAMFAPEAGIAGRALVFTLVGICVGMSTGFAQVVLRSAWLTVLDGYGAGRQLMLGDGVTTLGRADHLRLPFLGASNAGLELEHLRIVRQPDGRFRVEDNNSRLGVSIRSEAANTFEPLTRPRLLMDGDLLRFGPNLVRFHERARRASQEFPGPPPEPARNVQAPKPFPAPPPPPKRIAEAAGPPAEATTVPPKKEPYWDENVQFTVFRPKTIPPEVWCDLLASAHLDEKRPDAPADGPEPVEKARAKARAAFKDLPANAIRESTQDSSQAIPQGGQVTFVPQVACVQFNPPQQSFLWEEDEHTVLFRVRADRALDGKAARGRMTVFLGAILVADIPLKIDVGRPAAEVRTARRDKQPLEHEAVTARPYRKIFASYSHRDLAIVEQFERYAEAVGDEFLRDWKVLRPGDRWNDRLLRMIDEADVFQLFWSCNAMESQYVRREWEYALNRGREGFVRPVYWEDPFPRRAPDLPPPELSRLHFQSIAGMVKLPAGPETRAGEDESVPVKPERQERSRRTAYAQEISRAYPRFILVLLQQSFSMQEPLAGAAVRMMDAVADAINAWLGQLVIHCTGSGGIRNDFHVSVLGYRTDLDGTPIIEPAFGGALVAGTAASKTGLSIRELGNSPARIERRRRQEQGVASGGPPVQFPVWVEGRSEGGAPMCAAFYEARVIVEDWIREHHGGPPPLVIHMTSGESQDGDPVPYSESLRDLESEGGRVLLLNCDLSSEPGRPVLFPDSDELLPDELGKALFAMSSVLPDQVRDGAAAEGIEVGPGGRGMVFRADQASLELFFNIMTRIAVTH